MSNSKWDAPSNQPSRVFVDASFTFTSGKNTGIERVVRNVLQEAEHVCDLPVTTIFGHGKQFYSIGPEQERILSKPRRFQANVQSHLPSWYLKCAGWVCKALPLRFVRKWLLPHAGHLGAFKLPHLAFDWTSRRRAATDSNRVEPRDGDLVLLPDAYWTEEQVWKAARQARERGAFVATLIYDLIPMLYPEYVSEKRRLSFIKYLRDVATHSDVIVTISDTVRKEVVKELPTLCGDSDYCKDVRAITLGAELNEVTGEVRSKVIEVFETSNTNNPYIMVGSFDPRKNHSFLLDAFEILWKCGSDRKLCFIGRVGSLSADVIDRIYQHEQFGKKLFVFHDLTDCELHYCYRNSRGVLMASVVEGFGLPIVEALWHGKKTFVSNTPIHREVGGSFCDFFDLKDPQELTDLILRWESNLADGASLTPVSYQPVTWRESVAMLFDASLAAYAQDEAKHQTVTCVA